MTSTTRIAPQAPSTAPRRPARTTYGRNFLSDVVIDYGPPDQLGRLFLKADTEMREFGLNVSFVPFDELVAINRANSESWRPILPIFDPEIGGIDESKGFAVVGRDSSGRAAYAHACRLYSLGDATLKEEIESLRIFYSDPDKSRGEGEEMRVTAPSAATTMGPVVFIGAVWYRPDYRKRDLMSTTSPLVRGLALTRWYSDFSFSFMAEDLVHAGTAAKAHFPNVEWEIQMMRTPVYRKGFLRAALVWTDIEGQLAQVRDYLGGVEPQVDPVVEDGAAQKQRRA